MHEAEKPLQTPEDVIKVLLKLEQELIKQREILDQPLSFVIFGGTAVLLYSKEPRYTSDIDCYLISRPTIEGIIELMDSLNVNNMMQGVMQLPPPEDFLPRAKKFYDSDVMEIYIASREDVILSKLFTDPARDYDEQDILLLLREADIEYIRSRYEEYLKYYVGRGLNIIRLDDILEKYENMIKYDTLLGG